ncbi:MAG: hypothetical protein VKK42_01650 [Lyngbya sp.]|nr:hypothetical protein [Lyngbya sp.]
MHPTIILPHQAALVHHIREVVAKFHKILDVMHPTSKTNPKIRKFGFNAIAKLVIAECNEGSIYR